ncbi:MAG TPA: glucose-6-phosphate isomerase [Ruminiclostridium sp.]|jgi:glucose-6-phosphate isomerase|nr:glucose-6-phosphate isomerase [Ruminiclostridium sp.]
MIGFDYTKTKGFVSRHEIEYFLPYVEKAHEFLHEKSGPGNSFTDWVRLPVDYDREEFSRIKDAAERIRNNSDVFIVIGIGGSYLGARAAIEALNHTFYNQLPGIKRNGPQIYFAGNNISSDYIADLLEVIDGKDISVNVISKSGTTTEPAIAFRIFREYMEKKYGAAEARKRIIVTTDRNKGALRAVAASEGYETFTIPDGIGGRFSVLTAVGLLPIAVSGISIDQIMEGAAQGYHLYSKPLHENPSYQYAAVRNALYRKMKTIEIMVNFEPCLHYFTEWWKQLFGESEGKDGKGIFPAGVDFTTDLHSMGQYIQDGIRNIFETVLNINSVRRNIAVNEDKENDDGLNYLAGKNLSEVNKKAMEGTIMAHVDGNVPVTVINIPEMTAYYFGQLVYFFEKACGISGYILGVNPFDQPGVEAYKKNMFTLLGKPGYEKNRD